MTNPAYMEPVMPLADGRTPEKRRTIDNLASILMEKSAALHGKLNPVVQQSIGNLVRTMNCYYSNLIEAHHTHPIDIEKALKNDYATEPEKRHLQQEAVAHIDVQEKIDRAEQPYPTVTTDFIQWIHREFYQRLPEVLQQVEDSKTAEKVPIVGGAYRKKNVQVGQHIAVEFEDIPAFMQKFITVYHPQRFNKHEQVVAVAASHHRLVWIHPFLDGNGRTARLFSHAYLKEMGVGNSLWSISRGLARTATRYKEMLACADAERRGDLDGRGSLSLEGLQDFCIYFLEQCIDQVTFMDNLLKPHELLARMEMYINYEISQKRLHSKSMRLLKEALFLGEFARGDASHLLDLSTSQASKVLNDLIKTGLLVSESHKSKVKLGFPYPVLQYWLPNLYPKQLDR